MYRHLGRDERYPIPSFKKAKQTISELNRSLGRSRSTTSRELSRCRGQRAIAPREPVSARLIEHSEAVMLAV